MSYYDLVGEGNEGYWDQGLVREARKRVAAKRYLRKHGAVADLEYPTWVLVSLCQNLRRTGKIYRNP